MPPRSRARRSLLTAFCASLVVALPLLPSVAHADRPHATRSANACVSGGQPGYLHTCGPYIEDSNGQQVRLQAVNWYGFEANDFVAAGLDRQTYQSIIATVKRLGYNTLRIPFSNEMVETNPVVSALGSSCPTGEPISACRTIDGQALLGPNVDLYGLTSLDILKKIVDYAGSQGLYVILDDHRSRAGWSSQADGLWYDAAHGFPRASFLADWRRIALLFNGDPALTGVDLFNEPHSYGHPTTCAAYLAGHGASWGSCAGQSNPDTDWRAAATQAGNAVLGLNPNLLVIVEGTTVAPNGAGGVGPDNWGTSLAAAATQPVALASPGHLVYSVHEYWWDQAGADTATMEARWTHLFGYLTNPSAPYATPVWIGEFGTCVAAPSCVVDATPNQPGYWFDTLVRYLNTPTYPGAPPYGWSVWPLNGTSPDAYDFVRHAWARRNGDPEPYGLLNADWTDSSIPELQSELFGGARLASAPGLGVTDGTGNTTALTDTATISATTAITGGASAPWPPLPSSTPAPVVPAPVNRAARVGAVPWVALPAPDSWQTPPRYPLSVRLALPRAAAVGRPLRFAVTLTNTSARPVRFNAGCPSYSESLSIAEGSNKIGYSAIEQQYTLNCGAVAAIPRGGSVTFAMVFEAPSWATLGLQTLTWSLDGGSAVASSARASLTLMGG